MTEKSLSEKICEVCGIEPIEEKYCYFECKNPEYKDKLCNKTECEHYKYIVHYIDFENAENFKKLFNLKYGRSNWETVAYRLMKCPYQIKDTTEFLEKFLNMLKYHKCYDTERIIKIIREAKWEV